MIESLLDHGLKLGADFVEVFREESRQASMVYKDSKVESVTAGTDFGFGIRLIRGSQVLYVDSSMEDAEHLKGAMSSLVSAYGWDAKTDAFFHADGAQNFNDQHPVTKAPHLVGQQPKLEWCKRADVAARGLGDRIQQVTVGATDKCQQVLIANTEGVWVEDSRTRCRFNINATAGDGNELAMGSETPGAMAGMEFFENLDIEALAISAAERSLRMLEAGYIDGGKMPVVIGPAFGGVIFHEACGHPLETEAHRKNASPFVGKIGEAIAQPCLTAIDDGLMAGSWGSVNVDDEGMPTQKTTLIENGVLVNLLSDRVGAMELDLPRTGSGRRESYRYAPVSRMRNTYIAAGQDSFDDMVSSTGDGLYAKVLGGGSVNPATGEFNFSVQEGYRIRDGKVAEPVRGATLIGKGHEIMPEISMVGPDLDLAAGMCGASSGSVPVTVGQPSIKVDDILVGGR